MFIKIPNYYIDADDWTEKEIDRPFIILNTKHIVSVSFLIENYIKRKVYVVEITTINGETFQFNFLNKKTADEYINLLQTNNLVIE